MNYDRAGIHLHQTSHCTVPSRPHTKQSARDHPLSLLFFVLHSFSFLGRSFLVGRIQSFQFFGLLGFGPRLDLAGAKDGVDYGAEDVDGCSEVEHRSPRLDRLLHNKNKFYLRSGVSNSQQNPENKNKTDNNMTQNTELTTAASTQPNRKWIGRHDHLKFFQEVRSVRFGSSAGFSGTADPIIT